jgi:glycosyltransferase involved in cell wall biosynthesis
MKLQILVPQYKETENIIKPLLDSIEIQQNVDLKNDIGVIIVNDGTDVILSQDFLNRYTYPIEYYLNEHKGVSATRNACLDHATADYVMFCDADDMFYNACGLYIVFREINGTGFDSLVSAFVEESRIYENNEPIYINHDMDSTFVHGKIHRRQFLIDNQIRWNEDLTIHEDSYFNCLCQKLAVELKYCQTPFYLWKWRYDSVCRHDPKYILKTYNNMLDSNTALVSEFLRRTKIQDAQFYAVSMIFDAYFTMNKSEWLNQENQTYRIATERRFKEYYKRFEDLYISIPEDVKAQIIMGIKNRMFGEGLLMESITFDDWIKHILKTY